MKKGTSAATAMGNSAVASFLQLRAHATVTSIATDPAVLCEAEPFHWNGSELVICSTGRATWPDLEDAQVDVLLMAGNLRFLFPGDGSTDQVSGIAPEYREQLVTYLGATRGHATADEAGASASTCRLFITPQWELESAGR